MRDRGKALNRTANLSLDNDLVWRARVPTPSLSDPVEILPAGLTDTSERTETRRQLNALIEASNGFIARHGAFGDAFSTL